MIPTYSLRIIFPTSRSKNFQQAIKLASYFNSFEKGDLNIVDVSMKEVFEKWEYFNLLFWRTVKWKGMILEWEGMEFYSHTHKTRIFYALQDAQLNFICFLEAKIRNLKKVHDGELKYEHLDSRVYSEKDMNYLIESFKIVKMKKTIKAENLDEGIPIRKRAEFLRYRE